MGEVVSLKEYKFNKNVEDVEKLSGIAKLRAVETIVYVQSEIGDRITLIKHIAKMEELYSDPSKLPFVNEHTKLVVEHDTTKVIYAHSDRLYMVGRTIPDIHMCWCVLNKQPYRIQVAGRMFDQTKNQFVD